jgi:hypothetical protein
MNERKYLLELNGETKGDPARVYLKLYRMNITELLEYLRKCGLRVPSDTEMKNLILAKCRNELSKKLNGVNQLEQNKLSC